MSPDPSINAPIVDAIAEVTPTWLTAVLQGAGFDAATRGVSAEPVGTGQMGSCYRLFVDYVRGDGPATLVVKLPSVDLASREHARLGYRCETEFYRRGASNLNVRIPTCYFAESTAEGESFTLVLEDLAPAEQGDQIAGCTVDQARDAAVNIAGLHGPTWCDPSIRELDWVIPGGPESAEFMGAFLRDATAAFLERYQLSDATTTVLDHFAERSVEWATGRLEPFALVHSDYRLDNLMFAPPGAPDPVIAVDWQVVTVGLPLRDVAFLLATGLTTDDRRRAEHNIVEAYHGALMRAGVADYNTEQCWEDYRYGLFQAPMITVLGAFVAKATERGDEMFTVMAERSASAITDLDAFALL